MINKINWLLIWYKSTDYYLFLGNSRFLGESGVPKSDFRLVCPGVLFSLSTFVISLNVGVVSLCGESFLFLSEDLASRRSARYL